MASTAERIANINADLWFILDDNSVPAQTQAKLSDDGFTTIRLFSNTAESKAEIRELLAPGYGLNPATDPSARRVQAAVLASWDGSRELCRKETELRAEAR
eukprot:4147586-Amphidinium_carterae.1